MTKITLRPVRESDTDFLYDMLKERTPDMSIAHKKMPTLEQHRAFMASNPYAVWYIIEAGSAVPVGHTYLTKHDEIGVFVLEAFHHMGFGLGAVRELMRLNKRDNFKANINPRNTRSQNFFAKMGFTCVQFTFTKEKA